MYTSCLSFLSANSYISFFCADICDIKNFSLMPLKSILLNQSLCGGCFQKVDCYVCALDFCKITASLKQRSCVAYCTVPHSPFITRHPTVIHLIQKYIIFQTYHPIESIPIEQWHMTDSYVCINPLILMKWWWRRIMGGILRMAACVLRSFFTYEYIIPMGGSVE